MLVNSGMGTKIPSPKGVAVEGASGHADLLEREANKFEQGIMRPGRHCVEQFPNIRPFRNESGLPWGVEW